MEEPDAARLLWSPSQFTNAALKLPHEASHDAGQVVTEVYGQAAALRLMEVSFLPPLLPACGPSLLFAEPQCLFWSNGITRMTQSQGGTGKVGLGEHHHNAACASPRGSCWWSKAQQDMAVPLWPCHAARVLQWSRSIFSPGRDALLACVRDLCVWCVLWHRRLVPTYTLVVGPTYQSPRASHRQGQEISGVRVSPLQCFPSQKPPP